MNVPAGLISVRNGCLPVHLAKNAMLDVYGRAGYAFENMPALGMGARPSEPLEHRRTKWDYSIFSEQRKSR